MKLLFPLIAIVVALGIFIGYVNPQYQKIKSLQVEAARFEAALEQSRQLVAIRERLQNTGKSIPQADLDNLQKLLPDQIDNIRLAMNLDGMAARYGMRVNSVNLGTSGRAVPEDIAAGGQPYGSVMVTFSVAATYDTFRKFLADLESSLRLVDVVGLSFSSSQGDLYGYQISLRTYWLK